MVNIHTSYLKTWLRLTLLLV